MQILNKFYHTQPCANFAATAKTVLFGSVYSFVTEHHDTCSMDRLFQILFLTVMMNSLLFCRNLLVFPPLSLTGLVPYQLS